LNFNLAVIQLMAQKNILVLLAHSFATTILECQWQISHKESFISASVSCESTQVNMSKDKGQGD